MFASVLKAYDKNNDTEFKPEFNVPLVLTLSSDWLRHAESPTGGLYEIGCGWHARTRLDSSRGAKMMAHSRMTPEELLQRWQEVVHLDDGNDPSLTAVQDRGTLDKIALSKATVAGPVCYQYDHRDIILYSKL